MISPDPNHRVLLIDDNRHIHEDFRKILCPPADALQNLEEDFFGGHTEVETPPAFEVESAYQGEEGIALLEKAVAEGRPYSVAFIDVRMPPGIDGIQTAERLWQISPDLEVVICTAFTDYSWGEMSSRLSNRDKLLVLKKPFAAIEVLQMACGLTEKWTLKQQARARLSETEQMVAERTVELREKNRQLGEEIESRRSAEKHLLRAQRLESVGTLASGMAHDLNNTISPILMAAQLLRDELSTELHEQMVETIETSAERAAGIVKQVLTFARGAEGDRVLLEPKYLVLEIEKIAVGTFARSITVRSRLGENLGLIRGDRTLLQQVLMNVCLNARDAMKQGGNLLVEADEVEVTAEQLRQFPDACVGHYVRMRVSDTGVGIPPESMAKIFDPFFTTKELGQGTGLGLSMVASIVKGHDGFIDVQSEPELGTIFSIYLPSVPQERKPEARRGGSEPAVPPGHGEVILVVDDEEAIRDATTLVLSRHGYRVLTARDGAEGLALYTREAAQISLVVTDLMMPVMDGVEFSRALRKLNAHVPIIASSGYASDKKMDELATLRLQAVLGKPFKSDVLLSTIRDVLRMPVAA